MQQKTLSLLQFQKKFGTEKACQKKLFRWIWLMGRQKSGISMLSMQRMLEVKTYKTVWTMGHKIRKALADRDAHYKLAGLIEMDDTYFGAPKPGKRGRGAAGKAKV